MNFKFVERLALKLIEFNFKIIHKTGASLRMADILSRFPIQKSTDQNVCSAIELINMVRNVNLEKLQLGAPWISDIRRALLTRTTRRRKLQGI